MPRATSARAMRDGLARLARDELGEARPGAPRSPARCGRAASCARSWRAPAGARRPLPPRPSPPRPGPRRRGSPARAPRLSTAPSRRGYRPWATSIARRAPFRRHVWWIGRDPRMRRPPPIPFRNARKIPHEPRNVGWPATCSCMCPREDSPMSRWWTRGVQWLGAVALVGTAATGVACGGGSSAGDSPDAGRPKSAAGADAGSLTGDAGNLLGNSSTLQSITVDPPTASIESLNGVAVTQAFTVTGHFTDGTTKPVPTGVSWSASEPGSRHRRLDGPLHGQRLARRRRHGAGLVHGPERERDADREAPPAAEPRQRAPGRPGLPRLGDDPRRDRRLGLPVRRHGVAARPPAADPPVERRRGDRRLLRAHREPDLRARRVHRPRPAPRPRRSPSTTATWAAVHRLDVGRDPGHGRALGRHGGHAHRQPHVDHRARVDARHHLLLVEQPRPRAAHQAGRDRAGRLREPAAAERCRASTCRRAA